MLTPQATKFFIGQIINHRLLNYRGVIIDVDFNFVGNERWYRKLTLNKPNKQQAWYHILVDNTTQRIYAPEEQLVASTVTSAITHPLLSLYFSSQVNGIYQSKHFKH